MNFALIISVVVFVVAYFFIIQEKIHKTIIVLLATTLLALFKIYLPQGEHDQFAHIVNFIDFNVLALIIGLMIIVRITEKSGIFTALAMKLVAITKGNIKLLFFLMMMLTMVMTATLNNVATVIILTPILLVICYRFKLDPLPFFITEIILANLGGAATPVGDMTNMIISSKAGFSFSEVVENLGPMIIVASVVIALLAILIFHKKLPSTKENLDELTCKNWVTDKKIMYKGIIILTMVIVGFVLHEYLAVQNGVIALGGAMLMLLVNNKEPKEAFDLVEWPIIFFFIGLFALIGALEVTGVIDYLAIQLINLFGTNLMMLTLAILFGSALFSAFVDNVPFATAMVPIIFKISQISGANPEILFWALTLGACIGGAGTLIGASPNLIIAGIAEQNEIHLSFGHYFKYGFPLMLIGIVISAIYLVLFYF